MFLEFWSVVASIAGLLMSVSWFTQSAKIWKTKSAKDLSLIQISIFTFGNIIWLIYGILIRDIPVILSFAVGLVGVSSVLILTIRYGKLKYSEKFL